MMFDPLWVLGCGYGTHTHRLTSYHTVCSSLVPVIFSLFHTFENIGLRSAQNLVQKPGPKMPALPVLAHPGLWQLLPLGRLMLPQHTRTSPLRLLPDQRFLSPSGNVYKFQTGSRFHAILWHKHLDDACKSNRPQVTSPDPVCHQNPLDCRAPSPRGPSVLSPGTCFSFFHESRQPLHSFA